MNLMGIGAGVGATSRALALTRRIAGMGGASGGGVRTRVTWVWVVTAILLGLLTGKAAVAQPISACYEGKCYDALSIAEAAMRADPPYGSLAKSPKSSIVSVNATTTVTQLAYEIDSREPELFYAPGFLVGGWGAQASGCTPSASNPSLCAEESTIVGYFAHSYKANFIQNGCTIRNEHVTGEFATPFARSLRETSDSGSLDFLTGSGALNNRHWGMEANCPGWNDPTFKPYDYLIVKGQKFKCPSGFYARAGWAPGYAPAGTAPSSLIEGTKLCQPAVSTKYITVTTTQVASCGTKHPCHPTTGDKSRSEVDFSFAGRDFVRSYHSLGQLGGNSGSAPGWIHTYEERIEFYQAYNLIDESGYLEGFESLGNGRFRGRNSIDRMMTYISGGPFRLRDGAYVKEFNASGRLIAVIDEQRPRNSTSLAYVDGLLSTVTDATGRQLKFVYEFGRLVAIRLPDGGSVSYAYDDAGNLSQVDYGGGAIRHYHYHEVGLALPRQTHLLTGITSENGARYATFAYDAKDRVISSVLHGADGQAVERTHVDYLSDTSVSVTTDGRGTKAINIQAGMYRRPLTISDEAGTTTNTYRTDGRISSKVLPNGSRVEYEYADTYQSAVTEAAGTASERRLITERDSFNRVLRRETWSKDGSASKLLSKTVWTYNSRGQVSTVSEQDPELGLSRVTSSRYCEELDVSVGNCPIVGLLTSIDGPRNDVNDLTTYEYRPTDDPACATYGSLCAWRKGDLWRLTNAKGQTTETIAYDGAGRPLSTKDSNGVVTDVTYDARGRLTSRTVRASN